MDEWKLVVGVLVVATAAVFVFVFFFGSNYDYNLPGVPKEEGKSGLCAYAPQWLCPPPRQLVFTPFEFVL